MSKEIIKTIAIILLIGFASYILFGSIATLTPFVLPIYGLSLVRSKNDIGIKTVLIAMLLLVLIYLTYLLI